MAEPLVLADASDGGGEALGEDQLAEELGGILVDLLDGGTLVPAVEKAEEVAPVAPVEREQSGRLSQGAGHETGSVVAGQAAGGEPGVALHDVGSDERVLE